MVPETIDLHPAHKPNYLGRRLISLACRLLFQPRAEMQDAQLALHTAALSRATDMAGASSIAVTDLSRPYLTTHMHAITRHS